MIDNSSLLKISEIQKGLKHPDSEIRIQSIKDLISLHEPKYIDQLLELSKSETDVQIKFEIRKGIGLLRKLEISPIKVEANHNTNIKKVESALESGQEDQIHKAFRYITQYRLKQFLPKMMDVANDTNSSYLKGMVLKLMLSLGGEIYFEQIISYLNDNDPRVVSTAIETVESIGNTKALSLIAQLVTHEHNRVQATAMKALYNLGDSSALNLFKKMIRSKHSAYRNSAVYALKEMKIKSSIPLLKELINDESQSVREKALAGLEALAADGSKEAHEILNIKDPVELPKINNKDKEENLLSWIKETLSLPTEISRVRLLKCLKTDQPSDKCLSFILSALAQIGISDDTNLVRGYLNSNNDRVRANTVECLAALMSDSMLLELQPYLTDFNNRVVGNAIMALYETLENESLKSLDTLIKSNSKNEQLTAVFVMGAIGEDPVLQHSEYLLESPFPEVREKIIKILEDLSQDSAIAHRFIKQNQLRMAAFIPIQKKETPKETPKITFDKSQIGNDLTKPQEDPPTQNDAETEVISEQVSLPTPSNNNKFQIANIFSFLKNLKEKMPQTKAINSFSNSDYEITSLALLLVSYAYFITILLSSFLLSSHTFISYVSKNLRTFFLNEIIFTVVMLLIFPISIIYFYIQNKLQIEDEELIIGPIIGFSLFLFVPTAEILNLSISSFNFLSHDSIDLMFYQMPSFKSFAYVFYSLPLLILPVAIESFLIHPAVRKIVAIIVSFVCIVSIVWMSTLNQHSAVLLQEIKNENLYSYYFTEHQKALAIKDDTRIRLLLAQSKYKRNKNKKLQNKIFKLKSLFKLYKSKEKRLQSKLTKLKK